MPARRECLVIVRAGPNSLHRSWIDFGSPRSFDLLVAAYSREAPAIEDDGVTNVYLPGWKVQGFSALFAQRPDLFSKYRHIALVDDDIETKQFDIEKCFDIGRAAGLSIWQPSLSWNSYFSHGALLKNPSSRLRYVNFVEMMCPFFEARYLEKIISIFSLGYETGIDTVWARFMKDPRLKAAVIDDISFHHTRPVGALKQQQGFGAEERYDVQARQFAKLFGTVFPGGFAYGAQDHCGRVTFNRFVIATRALQTFLALRQTPMDRGTAARLIAAFIRHTLTRKPTLETLEITARINR